MSTSAPPRRPGRSTSNDHRTRAAMDPRLRARRAAVARAEGRRRLRIVGVLTFLTAAVAFGFWAVDSPLFDVDEVQVTGIEHLAEADVRAAAAVEIGTPLLDVDLTGAAERVALLPWVASVAVEREVNGTVTVIVVERTPEAALPATGGGYVLVDTRGRQLEHLDAAPQGTMPVAGIGLDGELGTPVGADAQRVLRVMGGMTEPVEAAVSQIIVDQGGLFLALDRGGRVRLGDQTGLEQKMVSLETMLVRVDLRCLHEIDLRVAGAPSLTRRHAGDDPRQPVGDLETCL